MEVICVHLARAEPCKVVAARLRMTDRARVGRIADVVVFRAGGIELDGEPSPPGLDAQDLFRRRRAADVAHADEQNSTWGSGLRHDLHLPAEALVIVQVEHVEPGDNVIALGASRG